MARVPGLDRVRFVARVSCPLHDADAGEAAGGLEPWKSVRATAADRSFRLLKCPRCGVALTDPYPSEDTVHWLYEGRGSDNYDPVRGTVMDWLKDLFARRDIRKIHDQAGRLRFRSILDFGTGNGRFALACSAVFPGSRVDAADLQPDPPASLSAASGVRYLPVGTFQQESGCYDLIILRHVMEHVHDPLRFLASLARRLSPEGVLYLEVPNADSAHSRFFGSSANAYYLPYHLFHFDRRSLGAFLGSVGLDSRISTKTLPLAGCVLAASLKQQRSLIHQVLGIVLHPIQVLMDGIFGNPTLAAVCTRSGPRHARGAPA